MASAAAAADPRHARAAGPLDTALRGVAAGRGGLRGRRGSACRVDELVPQTIGHASLGVALAAYERWLTEDGGDLQELLDEVFRALESGLVPEPAR